MNSAHYSKTSVYFSLISLVAIAGASNIANALEYECTATNEQRFIRLEIPGQEHLCEVSVTLKSGERDVKWYANNNSAFCSDKTKELKNKYEQQWGFSCAKWPDTDGIDELSKRQRVILDAELKKLIASGQQQEPPFNIKAVKATASPGTADEPSILALQFFKSGNSAEDITYVIHDNGLSWFTLAQLDSLSSYIPDDTEYQVNGALISSISENGTLEISTFVSNSEQQSCYGNQTFSTGAQGNLMPRTPHRFVCQ